MRRHLVVISLNYCLVCLSMAVLLVGCGGGSNGDGNDLAASSSGALGTFSLNVTDAKPLLPDNTEKVLITFEEVDVHKTGEGWTSLPLAQEPYKIDLLQFQEGKTTELVPPVSLESGKYTQIRIVVSSAELRTNAAAYSVTVPSASIKTDTQFDFEMKGGGAVHVTVDFDLSQSIVVTGQQPPSYTLKPVFHINETLEAATIYGEIAEDTFVTNNSGQAIVTVVWDENADGDVNFDDEIYTQVVVTKDDPAEFRIFWLVPEEAHIVQVDLDGNQGLEFKETVSSNDLPAGALYDLGSF